MTALMQETPTAGPLDTEELRKIDAYWRAANYLSVGQIYLMENPLLREPLRKEQIKPRLLGHWGTTPGLNFIYAHMNRVIKSHDLNAIYVCGPGHGGPGMVANTYLEGTYSEIYPSIPQNEEGMKRLFRQFSFPGGIPSHASPETPGSINEGGELGYALLHAYGAVFDNPDLLACCVVGDGEAETGPCATSWHSNKFLNPARDGAVLPILHLNGYKIAGPTVLARIPHDGTGVALHRLRVQVLLRRRPRARRNASEDGRHHGHGRSPEIRAIQQDARTNGFRKRPAWPMIILRSPKGWTGPERTRRQARRRHVSRASGSSRRRDRAPGRIAHARRMDAQLSSRRALRRTRQAARRVCRAGAQRRAAHGRESARQRRPACCKELELPNFCDYAVDVPKPGVIVAEATRVMGAFLRDVMKLQCRLEEFPRRLARMKRLPIDGTPSLK